jgi:decaprenylphospho-beta-D-erythro-pentofuranosid-2-ulose 2-reductase
MIDSKMAQKRVVLFGATSAIAFEVARLYAEQQARIILIGRSHEKLKECADDLQTRGATVEVYEQDLALLDQLGSCVETVANMSGGVDVALIAHGLLPDHDQCTQDVSLFQMAYRVNFESPACIAERLAEILARQPEGGTIAVISSVAGDRGRKSNYIYGAAKSALSTYTAGLRNRYGKTKVHIMTVKPGFVSTPMTAHLKQGALFTTPQKVATDIVKGIAAKKDVLYTPWFWIIIMAIIKLIPEKIFKKTSL